MDGSLFTISFENTLIATEEIRVDLSGSQPLVFSEIRRLVDFPVTERRTVIVNSDLSPARYDLEQTSLGVRSLWTGERRDEMMDFLSNDMAWYGPVLGEGVTPAPDVMIEGVPSALPFALLTMRFTSIDEETRSTSPLQVYTMDLMEGLGASRPLTITTAPDRQGAVIGTQALEGEIGGGLNPGFTMWIRGDNRALYSVEIAGYRFSPWQALAHPALRQAGRLVIQRVSKLPELPSPPPPGTARRETVEFTGVDKTVRSGTLILPEGSGPFPCLVTHGSGGVRPRWDPGDLFAQQGWAVYAYDKAGVGESKGSFERGPANLLVQDARAAATMLAERPEIDERRIVFLGLGDGAILGALVLSSEGPYAGAILGSGVTATKLLPDLAAQQVRGFLAPYYGWNDAERDAYLQRSVEQWQNWLFEDLEEVDAVRRRVSLDPLRDWAEADPVAALSRTSVAALLLHGAEDRWTPVEGVRALEQRLRDAGQVRVTVQIFENLGEDLGADPGQGPLGADVQSAILAWLRTIGAR